MTKKGFTLMELLVSIFISGMVMMSLVAMWKAASTQTAEAQRQSIIKNENTIFLRKLYADFVSASEVICPKGRGTDSYDCTDDGVYIAVKEAVISNDMTKLNRITEPVCGENGNTWAENEDLSAMSSRCIKPSYTVYVFDSPMVYRCRYNFLDDNDETSIDISNIVNGAKSKCMEDTNRETVMPYVEAFSLQFTSYTSNGATLIAPEILIDYTVRKEFSNDLPPVYFKFKRLLTKKGGV